jgi:molybdopterin/thiamine biosynthesis adenylyltransferase/rhodanese-related sulfurtransferase
VTTASTFDPQPAAPGLPALSHPEMLRYSRHLILPDVGMEGQRKLKAARVLLVGTGGLGSPVALYLAAAGVGTLGLVDFDVVDETNLHRQVIHGTPDVGRPKIDSAADRIAQVNPNVRVERHETRLTSANAMEILAGYDVVVDGTDNFPTRYLVNDACVLLGKPNVYGSIFRFEGQLSVFDAARGPCYRCLFREPPPPGLVPSCAEGGVLGVLPGIIGTLQALETIKLVIGIGEPMIGRLLMFDALALRSRELRLRKDPGCPICGEHPTVTELVDYERFCGIEPDPAPAAALPSISPERLFARLEAGERPLIVDVREPREWEIANLAPHGARLLPLGEMDGWMETLDRGAEIVVHCKSGARSARAVQRMVDAGFGRVRNLEGGIVAWAEQVDGSLARY